MQTATSTERSDPQVFHPGEQAMQERLGVAERMAKLGPKVIRDHMPKEHRELFEKLPMLVIGALDDEGRPWATLLTGQPGFVKSPDPFHLEIEANDHPWDPVMNHLKSGVDIGLLGIELETRRRNRMNAEVVHSGAGRLSLRVKQSFGNCPRYIQKRQHSSKECNLDHVRTEHLNSFDERTNAIVRHADSFFISSLFDDGTAQANRGVDLSHRGGLPGFIQVEDERTLIFPDYSGNRFFNTLGNIHLNPLVGLLFIDYAAGKLLHLTGQAQILWDDGRIQDFEGAERLVRFQLEHGRLISNALALKWDFLEYSPSLLKEPLTNSLIP